MDRCECGTELAIVRDGLFRRHACLTSVVRERVLGKQELAELLGVKPDTVKAWRLRHLMPEPDLTVNGLPAWWLSTVERFRAAPRPPGRPRSPGSTDEATTDPGAS